jgi:hypothetical protein
VKQTSSSNVSNSSTFSNKTLSRDCEKNINNKVAQVEENRTLQQADEYKSDTSDEEVGSDIMYSHFSCEDKLLEK